MNLKAIDPVFDYYSIIQKDISKLIGLTLETVRLLPNKGGTKNHLICKISCRDMNKQCSFYYEIPLESKFMVCFASFEEVLQALYGLFKRLLNACQFPHLCVKAATRSRGCRFILAVEMFK